MTKCPIYAIIKDMGEVKLGLLNQKQKAKEMGVSEKTIYRWVKQDKIKYTYIPGSTKKWFFKE